MTTPVTTPMTTPMTTPPGKPALDVIGKRDLELGPFATAPAEPGPWAHWRMRNDENGVAWLLFDKKDAGANTLSEEVLTELDAVLTMVSQLRPTGLVIRSAKPNGFIAGADIGGFRGITDAAKVESELARGHAVLDRLDALPLPTVAVVHGYCLGGGLEIALACDHRIAVEGASFGFPEVLLGLHPGLGRTERARRARSLGLVDVVTQERHVRAAVTDAIKGKLKITHQGLLGRLLNTSPARSLLAKRMRREAEKKAPRANYPAPAALIDLWEQHGGDDAAARQKAEIASFAKLLVSDTAQNLVRVFFLRNKLKDLAGGKWDGRRIHVIGAGAMGG